MASLKENTPRYSFYPLSRFMYKLWLYVLISWSIVTISIYGFYFLIDFTSEKFNPDIQWVNLMNMIYIALSVLFIVGSIVVSYIYTTTMAFEIYSNEVVVRKGVVNKTEKHVPFRTITNISSRYGIFDKFFGIGTVEIETAGKSGQKPGPEEKIEGIANFVEVRDIVLEELRKFRSQYATGTETSEITDVSTDLPGAILTELREIKNLLARQR